VAGAAGRVAIGAGIGGITTFVVHDYVAVRKLVQWREIDYLVEGDRNLLVQERRGILD
jgi:hypothetical protein